MLPLEIYRDDNSPLLYHPITARWEPLRMDDKHRAFAIHIIVEAKRRKQLSENPKRLLDIVGGRTVSELEAIAKRKKCAAETASVIRTPTTTLRPSTGI